MSSVSIHLIARNSMGTLPNVVDAIVGQTYTDATLKLIDNASTDGVISYIRDRAPRATVIKNARDIGTAQAQNQAIRLALQGWGGSELDQKFVLFLENDITMEPNTLRELVRALEHDRELGAVGGKILRMFDENIQDEALHERVQSDHIDSVGLKLTSALKLVPRGAGEVDQEQYDFSRVVFAVPGAMMLVRASALQDVRHSDEEYLDKDFVTGREHEDLSWRLQNMGWRIEFVPTAIAYKYRGIYQGGEIVRDRYDSRMDRNELMMLAKNAPMADLALRAPSIALSRFASFPSALVQSLRHVGKMAKKRKDIFANRRIGNGAIREMIS